MWSKERQAARAVVLDADGRVLLLRARDPFDPGKGQWWELPGGGMEPGEPSEDAAAREILEETGLDGVDVGPCVWRHRARFVFAGIPFDQLEHIHVARWPGRADPDGDQGYRPGGLETLEAMAFSGMRWLDVAVLAQMSGAGETIIPPWLAEQLPLYLAELLPAVPVDLGELGPVF